MGFCGWPVQIPAEYADRWAAATVEQREYATALAGRVLWALTGQVLGVCAETVRPCFQPQRGGSLYRGFWPGITGMPGASGPCGCSNACSEIGYDRVALPGPVASVDEVLIDGITIDPATYKVQNRRWVHRVDGQRWPTHQDLHAADDAVGAFTIRYQRGVPLTNEGECAAGRLAAEFLANMVGGECRLPSGATSISRQGISVELVDVRQAFTEGVTGIPEVDLWIMAVNPHRSTRPARVTSPDRRNQIARMR